MVPNHTTTILCVEDHPDSLFTLSQILVKQGYEVLKSSSVNEALLTASSNWYDLLLCDIQLGDGTGYDVLSVLRTNKSFPAIAVTGLCFDNEMDQHYDAGFDEVIQKPYYIKELLSAIDRQMNRYNEVCCGRASFLMTAKELFLKEFSVSVCDLYVTANMQCK